MGRQLAAAYPVAAEIFSRADEILGFSLSRLCFEGPEEELRRTANAQPALLACSLATFRVLQENGLSAGLLAGHSLGEFTAWVAAGTIGFSAALPLVRKRGELMEEASRRRPGGMLAVLGLERRTLKHLLDRVREGILVIANLNCPGQIVVSGEEAPLRKLRELVLQEGARAIPLRVSGAFHSPLIEEGARLFEKEIERLNLAPAQPAVVCNVSGRPMKTPQAIRQAMAAQMTSPVQWEASVHAMAQAGIETFVEVGPGEVLCGLVSRTLNQARVFSTGNPEKLQEVISTFAKKTRPESPNAQVSSLPVPSEETAASEF